MDSPTPPRRARPTRRVPHLSQAVRSSWARRRAARVGRAAGFGQGASHALCSPRLPGRVPGPSHAPALALAAASRIWLGVKACPNPNQGFLTGGTVAARVEAGQGHADFTPADAEARGTPLPSLGLAAGRRDSCPIIDGQHGHHAPALALAVAWLICSSTPDFFLARRLLLGEATSL